jgi:hypothetical protein
MDNGPGAAQNPWPNGTRFYMAMEWTGHFMPAAELRALKQATGRRFA